MPEVVSIATTPWDIISAIALILTTLILGIGFFYAYRQLASARNARTSEIILSITARWDSKDMDEARSRINQEGSNLGKAIENADKENSKDLCILVKVANFFDALGLLVAEGFLDCPMAYNLFGHTEEHYYNMYQATVTNPTYKDYLPNFQKLHEIFEQEKKERAKASKEIKPRPRP